MQREFALIPLGKNYMCKRAREYEGYDHIQAEYDNTLKKNKSMNTTLDDEDKKSDTKDDEEDTDSNKTLAFNVVIDLGDTSMHNHHQDDSDDDFVYNSKELTYEELQR
ncbi:hypothetical protein M9H77_22461 [Catharanthus roseus]|uniref:Uncharacterized protein n=1 Tax=Catharanthus roseus TaxID=4058 RepID=A0ACC0AT58_CATRO|nr:hypothetical protein M9H77_22461 [Catharanthus roseus]